MPTIAGRTRRQIRQAVGSALGAWWSRDVSAAVSTTQHDDDDLFGADDAYNGYWIWVTSGAQENIERRVSDYTATTTRVTVSPAWAAGLVAAVTYELWDARFRPSLINDLINDAIIDIYGSWYDPEEDLSLALSGKTSRLVIPASLAIIQKVFVRESYTSISIHTCDTAFDELVQTGITVTLSNDAVSGQSNRYEIAAAAAANARATDNFSSLDLREYDYIEFWIKSDIATAAGDIHILLDDTAQAASALETLSVPALVADQWTFVRIALANPETDTALISVAIRFTTDRGATTSYVWLDDLRAVKNDSAVWTRLNWRAWSVDKEAGELVINDYKSIGARLLKIIGGDEPVLLTTDTTASEVSERYLIPAVCEKALLSHAGKTMNIEYQQQSALWGLKAARARLNFPPLEHKRYTS